MSLKFKKKYMEKFHLRYKKAKTRTEKTDLITELCRTCNWHRKHAIRVLSDLKRFTKSKPKNEADPQNMTNQK